MKFYQAVLLSSILFFISCKKKPAEAITFIKVPAGINSSESSLHKSKDGTIYLSWLESNNNKSQLFFSTLNEDLSWSDPKLIAQGDNWFVNWADFPSITSFGDNNLAAHYLQKSGQDTYAYDVKIVTSNDKGNTWNKPVKPHLDDTKTEHGFVSKIGLDNDSSIAVWLDGRQMALSKKDSTIAHQMTLRAAKIDQIGAVTQNFLIDDRTCDCCQTDMAMTQTGPIVVYRDRSDKEIRDIYYSRLVDDKWSVPQPVFNDNWVIAGCPVNGPAIAVQNSQVAVAWFTLANGLPSVKVAFSNNDGAFFNNPINVDDISSLGRVDIELLNDRSALVSWMDRIEGKTLIQMQRIQPNGLKSSIITVTESSESRSSGFPRMVIIDDFALLSWTNVNADNTSNIETATVALASMN